MLSALPTRCLLSFAGVTLALVALPAAAADFKNVTPPAPAATCPVKLERVYLNTPGGPIFASVHNAGPRLLTGKLYSMVRTEKPAATLMDGADFRLPPNSTGQFRISTNRIHAGPDDPIHLSLQECKAN